MLFSMIGVYLADTKILCKFNARKLKQAFFKFNYKTTERLSFLVTTLMRF